MHLIQQKILDLLDEKREIKMTLREIGNLVGDPHPQKIKHHLLQIEKRGFIKINKDGVISFIGQNAEFRSNFLNIPILGSANCGPATSLATNSIEGYLKVSKRILNQHVTTEKYFSIKAKGNSMNRAYIDNLNIEDGDYILIDSEDRTPENGKLVLSIIDGMQI